MKTILLTLLLVTAAAVLPASVKPADLIVQADPASRTLTLRTTSGMDVPTTLKIIDENGLVLHTSQLDSGAYLSKRFQLDALPAGKYSVVLTDVVSTTSQPIVIDHQGVFADPALATRTYYPHVELKDDLLTVNYLNHTGRSVYIRLYDQYGQEVIADRRPGTAVVQRAYNLENLPTGEYFVMISSGDIKSHTTSLLLD
ncbi:hypothetical protein [Lewinella sp. JB7]|uniref:hypothetical protein n=1 Tax=Lewinella sp. JB7 TaxID=2962887 RepID=UPI0020C9766C|nr:hypothetical protein [Lewinella sp. JB7]MCP9237120.1 hypothetical protein [Lewinella sp. JB7]